MPLPMSLSIRLLPEMRPATNCLKHGAIALVIFAVSFVAAAVLMDRAGTGQVQSLITGGVVALCVTAFILTIYGGVKLVSDGGLNDLDMETLLIGFAISLIASVIIDRLVLKI